MPAAGNLLCVRGVISHVRGGRSALRRVSGEICLCGGSRDIADEAQDSHEQAKPRHCGGGARFVGGSGADVWRVCGEICMRERSRVSRDFFAIVCEMIGEIRMSWRSRYVADEWGNLRERGKPRYSGFAGKFVCTGGAEAWRACGETCGRERI